MRKIYRFLCKAEEAACGAGLMFLILFVFASAMGRLFKVSESWYIDLSMLCLAWTSFLGADVAWRHGQILGVDLLVRNLPKKVQAAIEILVLAIIMLMLAVIVYFGIRLAIVDRLERFQSMPIPYALVTYSLVVASASMFFTTIQKVRRAVIVIAGKGASK
jgi:TRAP-type transport system small permease protein